MVPNQTERAGTRPLSFIDIKRHVSCVTQSLGKVPAFHGIYTFMKEVSTNGFTQTSVPSHSIERSPSSDVQKQSIQSIYIRYTKNRFRAFGWNVQEAGGAPTAGLLRLAPRARCCRCYFAGSRVSVEGPASSASTAISSTATVFSGAQHRDVLSAMGGKLQMVHNNLPCD